MRHSRNLSTRWFILIIALLLSIGLMPTLSVKAASINVNTSADLVTVDGLCSLREAITNANNDAATNPDCISGSGADTITLLAGTYTLTSGTSLSINSIITLQSSGGMATIEANAIPNNAAFRVFSIFSGSLTIDGTRVRNGGSDSAFASNGGCISVGANTQLTLQNGSIVEGCRTTAPSDGAAIVSSTGSTVTITDSTVQNNISGGNGGVIQAAAALSITNSTISGNSTAASSSGNGFGGAIACLAGCTLTVTGSNFTNNTALNTNGSALGGAIYVGSTSGTNTISSSTFTNNTASDNTTGGTGGGIYKAGLHTLEISDSTFTGNNSLGNGGAIYNSQGNLTVTASRIESNTASNGGAYYSISGGTDSITASCLVGNTATAVVDTEVGNDTTATANWWGTDWGPQIVAAGGGSAISGGDRISGDGVAASGDSIADVGVGLTSAGGSSGPAPTGNWLTTAPNIAGATCASASWTPPAVSTVTISPASFNLNEGANANFTLTRTGSTASALVVTVNITLGTGMVDADYDLTGGAISAQSGNGVTVTIPAGQASVNVNFAALDEVDAEADNTLTMALVDGAAYDLGATTISIATIPANDFVVMNRNDSGDGSLRQALTNANDFPTDDTITFAAAANGTITPLSNLPDVNSTLTISGNGPANTIISGGDARRVLTLASGSLTIANLTIRDGFAAGDVGGGIYAGGVLNVSNAQFIDNVSFDAGGAIFVDSSDMNISNSIFHGNQSQSDEGGALFVQATNGTLTNNLFYNNSASTNGGAFELSQGTFTVTNNTVSNNSAAQGAVVFANAVANLRNTIIANSTGSDCFNGPGVTLTTQNTLMKDSSCGVTSGVNGNLTGDPALNGDFTLSAASIAINAGDNSLIPGGVTTDLAGNARIQQTTVDMGAYESPFTPALPAVTLSATDNAGAELGSDTISFRVTRTGASTVSALTVNYTPAAAPQWHRLHAHVDRFGHDSGGSVVCGHPDHAHR
ncbi:MAG: choice-of-anchor Q domain-containing protein [Anaerolineae bacterium]